MDENPRIYVIRRPPQPDKRPVRHHPQLIPEGGREFRSSTLAVPLPILGGLRLDPRDLIKSFLEFSGFVPKFSPISVSDSRRESGTDRIEHVFSWVDIIRAHCAANGEIFADDG